MLTKVLVAIDGSKNSLEALRWAIKIIAGSDKSEIVMVNAQPSFQTVHSKRLFSQSDIREYQELLFEESVAEAKKIVDAQSIPYTLELLVGDPKQCIVDRVLESQKTDEPIEMIVMGSRGLGPIRSVLGGVSYGVIQAAICPVTIIPHKD
ncbi:Universal stress protein family [Oligella ureolytica]|uniref:Universal stress protein n=1 Tax=Oligella ureolytica TaxID=90244 RepID=A0A378XHD8_9BURK|nr:universal stress protein [Oligella ureolytica]QPT41219.1 universal stress protein [Oligella ureolytica]SUA54134.1 Universal stress protein family [Oligella ureolytica]SUA55121.1 Universal stress protein family [Oligella ureolytica]